MISPLNIIEINFKQQMNMTMTTKTINIQMWIKGPIVFNKSKLAIGRRFINTTIRTEKKVLKNEWHLINWKKTEAVVKNLQEKIVIATLNEKMKEVYLLQWKLLNTFEAKVLAIRKVITNKGKTTAGTDGIVWKSPKDYWNAIQTLTEIVKNPQEYRAQPLRKVWIPKANSKELRPLGIPTILDRAVQALYHLVVDPAVETKSDPNSYGFRRYRSTQDAITAIRSLMDKKRSPSWILEADISKCFDKINHEFLMKHTPICHKMVLKQWLKSGVMEQLNYMETDEGTPQGGVISPLLCNIALNGIEKHIKKANPLVKGISAGVNVIRYADDMIITGKSKEIAIKNLKLLSEFLKERGLELNEKKTLITHIKTGFDFLGFNVRRMKWNARLNNDTDQETVLIIKPSIKGIKKLKSSINKIIVMNKPIRKIISELNPILRGWGEHKRISYHTQETFISIDHWIYQKMLKWSYWHKGSLRKTVLKYMIPTNTRKWNWGLSKTEKLINLGEISIIILRPLKLDKNPYIIESLEYFEKRREKLIEAKFRQLVYKLFKQRCPLCNESLHNEETVELHHIIPQKSGGKYSLENIVPLHELCHKQITHGNQSLERFKISIPKIEKKPRKKRGNHVKIS
jgi:RNA-directed DNA polymerase